MPLFPAYAAPASDDKAETEIGGNEKLDEEMLLKDVSVPNEEDNTKNTIFFDELDLLKSDASNSSCEEEEKKNGTEENMTRKRKRKSEGNFLKKRQKVKDNEFGLDNDLDFYIDRKHDFLNLHVSTLYAPGRPQYNHIHGILGHPKQRQPKSNKPKRYFNMKMKEESVAVIGLMKSAAGFSSKSPNPLKAVETISDSGLTWNDDNIEATLKEKTEYFNKYLTDNPHDINTWTNFIRFQEDRYAFDVFNERALSESSARNVCNSKKLSIIEKCLSLNAHNEEIVSLQVRISEQTLPNDQYLALLKRMLSQSGVPGRLLCRLWLWYIEGVQCSMALCSVPCVKDMYAAAVKALSKALKYNYQSTHAEMLYMFGLFVRQSGLWEQLWLLIKMNVEMNVAVDESAAAEARLCFAQNEALREEEAENEMLKQEAQVISSGLPLHAVWWRCVRARSGQHWRPAPPTSALGGNAPLDPQRMAYPSDLLDFLEPITSQQHLFKLALNMIRLLKVPVLPSTHALQKALNAEMGSLDWEVDCIESALTFVYSILESLEPTDEGHLKAIANIMLDFVEQPTYFEDSNGFLSFVNDVMLNMSKWFAGREKTALLLWWVRLQRVLLALNRSNKSESGRVRKQVQKTLKANRNEVLLYAEFAALEADLEDRMRGLQVLQSALALVKPDSQLSHTYLARSLVKLLMQEGASTKTEEINKAINILISLADGKSLPSNLSRDNPHEQIKTTLQLFADKTDTLLLWMQNNENELDLVELMHPSLCVEWICSQGWFIHLTQDASHLNSFYDKIIVATDTDGSQSDKSTIHRRCDWVRESFMCWHASVTKTSIGPSLQRNSSIQKSLEQFPSNSFLVWSHLSHFGSRGPTGRWQLFTLAKASEKAQLTLALAMVFADFINLYRKDEGVWQTGHANRLHNLLQTFTKDQRYRRCALLWKMRIYFDAIHSKKSQLSVKNTLYLALDECPWNKDIYSIGCTHLPSEFSELIDLMMEKQLRLHAMPEELQPL